MIVGIYNIGYLKGKKNKWTGLECLTRTIADRKWTIEDMIALLPEKCRGSAAPSKENFKLPHSPAARNVDTRFFHP